MVLVIDSTPPPPAPAPSELKPTLAGRTEEGLRAALAEIGVPERQRRMRAEQLWSWIYVRGITSFDTMTDVSKDLRARLSGASR